MNKFYPNHWNNDPQFTYLGSQKNPHTGLGYDFYLYDRRAETLEPEYRYSFTCRHGDNPADYGSGQILHTWHDTSNFLHEADFIWGLEMAKKLCLYYLVTGKKPLLEGEISTTIQV
jgi:hypothetical protein